MGSGISSLLPCFTKDHRSRLQTSSHSDQTGSLCEPLDEILGHSYCYIPYSNRFISPFSSNRFVSPSGSFRLSPSHESGQIQVSESSEQLHTGFKAISGASISANTSNSKTVIQLDDIYDDAIKGSFGSCLKNSVVNVNGFEGTSSFSAFPLQAVPLGPDRVDLFMSGPIESLLGPVEEGEISKRKKNLSWHLNFGERKQHPWVLPVSNADGGSESDMQWASGKAGEDRVQLAVFEKQGWLFAGIYDGFNGPDAPEFLMANLYRVVHNELHGLFWEMEEEDEGEVDALISSRCPVTEKEDNERGEILASSSEVVEVKERKRLRELLVEAQAEDALDLSDSYMFACDNSVSVGSKRCLLMSKLKHGLSKQGMYVRKLFPWKFCVEKNEAEKVDDVGVDENVDKKRKRRKEGTIDHELVLKAMSNGLEATEQAFLEVTEKVLNTNPELALMGSCLLVALIRDDDVYIMNIGDSRALVAQYQVEERPNDLSNDLLVVDNKDSIETHESHLQQTKLVALQLTADHNTSIDDEIRRIKNEHPDDKNCIVNNRVKGRLKVTRAFGAGFLKQPKLNDALLGMFRNEYIGTNPYISCTPSLCHYRLTKNDQFMVISSDGLYQYLNNEEVVSLAMEKFPDGDPAQHIIHELLVRAAKKAGMSFHELLDIPQGDRRKYHDDCTVLVIALGGSRIWKSSRKYL